MILNLLRNTEFRDLAKLCSPALFTVVPPAALLRAIKALVASRAPASHAEVLARHAPLHAGDGVRLVATLASGAEDPLDGRTREAAGARLLRVYFRELLLADDALLDLRRGALRFSPRGLDWSPAPLSVRWSAPFLEGLRSTYRGFYGGDDALFRAGLRALELGAAEDLFRQHFGVDPRAVRFSTREFTHTFGLVFEACARARSSLHGDFVAFGFLLGALYQSLESLDVPLDVRAAFEAGSADPAGARS